MASSGMLRRVALTRRNIPEDAILHSHRRENLKSYRVGYGAGPRQRCHSFRPI
jgi:hypothetical protein